MAVQPPDFTGLKVLVFNGTLKPSPEVSNAEGLLALSQKLIERLYGNQPERWERGERFGFDPNLEYR